MELILVMSLLGLGAIGGFGGGGGSSDDGQQDGTDSDDGGGDDTPARDLRTGTDAPDDLAAEDGQDLRGLGGADTLTGRGEAIVRGDTGGDRIEVFDQATGYGGFGDDVLWADDESTIYGGEGNDFVGAIDGAMADGGAGDDLVQWYATANAPSGHSVLIRGGKGDDTIFGGSQDDGVVTLAGGTGDDLIVAGDGNLAIGSFGADTVVGGNGARLTGGEGADRFVAAFVTNFSAPDEAVTITDFVKGTDSIAVHLTGTPARIALDEVDGDTRLTIGWEEGSQLSPLPTTVLVKGVTGLTLQDFDFVDDAGVVAAADGTSDYAITDALDGPQFGTAGADSLTAAAGKPLLLAGAGNDTVTAGAGVLGGVISLGDGDDSYTATGALADLATGAGNDRVDYTTGPDTAPQADNTVFFDTSRVFFDTGAGDDQVTIRAPLVPPAPASLKVIGLDIDLGAGNDVITIEKDVIRPVQVYDGEGDDAVTIWMGQTVYSGAGADRITLNVDADHLTTRAPAEVIDLASDDRLLIQLESGITGAVTFTQVTSTDGGEPYTEVRIDGKTVVRFLGTASADDPRITVTRDAAFA